MNIIRQKLYQLSFLLLMNIVVNNVGAQSSPFVGIKAGVSVPNLKSSGDNPVSKGWSSRLGPYAGIVGEFPLSEKLSFQTELNYSSQGGKKDGTQAIPTNQFSAFIPPGMDIPPYVYAKFKSEVKLNYLELPVLMKVNFSMNETLSFFADGGFYGGLLLNAKNVTTGTSNIYSDENLTQPLLPASIVFDGTNDIKDDLKKFNFGIQGGIGLDMNISDKSKLILTAGGNYGLIHIQKDEANGKNNTGAATTTLVYLIRF